MRRPQVVVSCLIAALVGWASVAHGGPTSTTAAVQPGWIEDTLAALSRHLDHHPEASAEDVYKLLHQAVMGPGHAIPDRSAAGRWLADEARALGPVRGGERLCEPLGGDPAMVRIHLRPLLAVGGDLDALLTAFVASSAEAVPDTARLEHLLTAATTALAAADRVVLAEGLADLQQRLAPLGYPAVHHSDRFRQRYLPAYRVVTLAQARTAGWCR